jgi:hypothetical protein
LLEAISSSQMRAALYKARAQRVAHVTIAVLKEAAATVHAEIEQLAAGPAQPNSHA